MGNRRIYASPTMSRNLPVKITTKGGHRPRARIHAAWSPIGQKMRRTTMFRALGAVVALLLVLAFAADTIITDRNGVLLADVGNHGDHRLAVKLQDVAPVMIQATVAIEDKGFYSNPGFDAAAIIRAAYDNLRSGHIVGGASTITQQLAKQQFRS